MQHAIHGYLATAHHGRGGGEGSVAIFLSAADGVNTDPSQYLFGCVFDDEIKAGTAGSH